MTEPAELCYPVLTPFKLGGVTVKPPAFVQMPRDAAIAYVDAGVIGGEDEASLVPESDVEDAAKAAASTAKPATTPRGARKPNV